MRTGPEPTAPLVDGAATPGFSAGASAGGTQRASALGLAAGCRAGKQQHQQPGLGGTPLQAMLASAIGSAPVAGVILPTVIAFLGNVSLTWVEPKSVRTMGFKMPIA